MTGERFWTTMVPGMNRPGRRSTANGTILPVPVQWLQISGSSPEATGTTSVLTAQC